MSGKVGILHPRDLLCVLSLLNSEKMLVYLRLLDEGVQDIQYTVRGPDLGGNVVSN